MLVYAIWVGCDAARLSRRKEVRCCGRVPGKPTLAEDVSPGLGQQDCRFVKDAIMKTLRTIGAQRLVDLLPDEMPSLVKTANVGRGQTPPAVTKNKFALYTRRMNSLHPMVDGLSNLEEVCHVLLWRLLHHPMAQVEDMGGSLHGADNVHHPLLNDILCAEKHARVQVALMTGMCGSVLSRFIQMRFANFRARKAGGLEIPRGGTRNRLVMPHGAS